MNFVLLTRSLSKTELGIWALFLTITGIFETTKSNLLKNAHIKYAGISTDNKEKTIIASSSLLINILITLVFIILVIVCSQALGVWFNAGPILAQMLKWFIPGMVAMIFFSHFESIQQSFLDFKGGFAGHFARQVVFFSIILAYWFLKIPMPLTSLVIYQTFSMIAGTLLIYLFTRKYLEYQFKASLFWIKKITGYGSYIFGSGMVATIYTNLDQLMIARFMNPGSVAYYNVASRINVLIDIPSYAAADIIFPKASVASIQEGKEKVKYLFEKMVGILIAFTLPTAIFIILFPRFVTFIVAGPSYAAAATILQLYMITGIFRPAQHQAANLLNSIGRPKIVFVMNVFTLMALLVINYACLVRFGFYGAAIGTLIANLLSFTAWYFVMRKEIGLQLTNVFAHIGGTYKTIYAKSGNLLHGLIRKKPQ